MITIQNIIEVAKLKHRMIQRYENNPFGYDAILQ